MFLGQLQPWKLVLPKMDWKVELPYLFVGADNYLRNQLDIHVCLIDTYMWMTQLDGSHDRLSTALSAYSHYLDSGRINTRNCCYVTENIKKSIKNSLTLFMLEVKYVWAKIYAHAFRIGQS